MVVNKRKKNSRQRGSHTHGWGSKKKHRGAGNRGGRGMAGTGKRADQLKTKFWTEKYFGKTGFISRTRKKTAAINLSMLPQKSEINLAELGYNKLLGSGRISRKVVVHVESASAKAIEKIKQAGGSVILTGKKQDVNI